MILTEGMSRIGWPGIEIAPEDVPIEEPDYPLQERVSRVIIANAKGAQFSYMAYTEDIES